MASFDIAYNRTARWEGGYTDNPNDLGNYNSRGELVGTNWGISAQKYEDYLGRAPSKWDMLNMPKWQAKNIFRSDEWTRMRGDTIKSQPLANIIFDGLVNHGQGTSLLQEVLGIDADNIYGPKTAEAVKKADPVWLYEAYKARRRQYYQDLIKRRPQNKVFLEGWLRRIDSFKDFVHRATSAVKDNPGAAATGLLGFAALAYLFNR